ncbi:hypothetical protein SNEBB_008421 [Seison nebaliae]|nr:hypothetical protein SNEBB_008421 [Seison nebaliae]
MPRRIMKDTTKLRKLKPCTHYRELRRDLCFDVRNGTKTNPNINEKLISEEIENNETLSSKIITAKLSANIAVKAEPSGMESINVDRIRLIRELGSTINIEENLIVDGPRKSFASLTYKEGIPQFQEMISSRDYFGALILIEQMEEYIKFYKSEILENEYKFEKKNLLGKLCHGYLEWIHNHIESIKIISNELDLWTNKKKDELLKNFNDYYDSISVEGKEDILCRLEFLTERNRHRVNDLVKYNIENRLHYVGKMNVDKYSSFNDSLNHLYIYRNNEAAYWEEELVSISNLYKESIETINLMNVHLSMWKAYIYIHQSMYSNSLEIYKQLLANCPVDVLDFYQKISAPKKWCKQLYETYEKHGFRLKTENYGELELRLNIGICLCYLRQYEKSYEVYEEYMKTYQKFLEDYELSDWKRDQFSSTISNNMNSNNFHLSSPSSTSFENNYGSKKYHNQDQFYNEDDDDDERDYEYYQRLKNVEKLAFRLKFFLDYNKFLEEKWSEENEITFQSNPLNSKNRNDNEKVFNEMFYATQLLKSVESSKLNFRHLTELAQCKCFIGCYYYRCGKYTDAIKTYESIINQFPFKQSQSFCKEFNKFYAVHIYIAICYYHLNLYDKSLDHIFEYKKNVYDSSIFVDNLQVCCEMAIDNNSNFSIIVQSIRKFQYLRIYNNLTFLNNSENKNYKQFYSYSLQQQLTHNQILLMGILLKNTDKMSELQRDLYRPIIFHLINLLYCIEMDYNPENALQVPSAKLNGSGDATASLIETGRRFICFDDIVMELKHLSYELREANWNLSLLNIINGKIDEGIAIVRDLVGKKQNEKNIKANVYIKKYLNVHVYSSSMKIIEQSDDENDEDQLQWAINTLLQISQSRQNRDTIDGRLCHLTSIESFFESNDIFNYNYAITLCTLHYYGQSLSLLKKIVSADIQHSLCYRQAKIRCEIALRQPDSAWISYLAWLPNRELFNGQEICTASINSEPSKDAIFRSVARIALLPNDDSSQNTPIHDQQYLRHRESISNQYILLEMMADDNFTYHHYEHSIKCFDVLCRTAEDEYNRVAASKSFDDKLASIPIHIRRYHYGRITAIARLLLLIVVKYRINKQQLFPPAIDSPLAILLRTIPDKNENLIEIIKNIQFLWANANKSSEWAEENEGMSKLIANFLTNIIKIGRILYTEPDRSF